MTYFGPKWKQKNPHAKNWVDDPELRKHGGYYKKPPKEPESYSRSGEGCGIYFGILVTWFVIPLIFGASWELSIIIAVGIEILYIWVKNN